MRGNLTFLEKFCTSKPPNMAPLEKHSGNKPRAYICSKDPFYFLILEGEICVAKRTGRILNLLILPFYNREYNNA